VNGEREEESTVYVHAVARETVDNSSSAKAVEETVLRSCGDV
jgi:hypothetical protein